ncbi:hypothetical protein HNY73_008489 [Argiope bruennichi]|uniref:Uncharacterized protein n=1 Tax=Argiope bruennichi TaxID=94029 RepID=A0A8T0F6K0_ARGBR|nr:hypothetical protein HNY73_008489 [Argiope bruennichi]
MHKRLSQPTQGPFSLFFCIPNSGRGRHESGQENPSYPPTYTFWTQTDRAEPGGREETSGWSVMRVTGEHVPFREVRRMTLREGDEAHRVLPSGPTATFDVQGLDPNAPIWPTNKEDGEVMQEIKRPDTKIARKYADESVTQLSHHVQRHLTKDEAYPELIQVNRNHIKR